MSTSRILVTVACALAALAAPAAADAKDLFGTVGPGFTIELRDQDGRAVRNLEPGDYRIVVEDRSVFHNFHLAGPGVNQATDVESMGTVTWNVTLREGVYTFVCDPHRSAMQGTFTVGTPAATPPPAPRRLVATVGPRATISLTLGGRRVGALARGTYTLVVRDRSRVHDFHLVGPRVNRRTSVRGVGTFTWRVTLRAGTYRFVCDPHARRMRGSFHVH